MIDLRKKEIWFVTGSQHLYGEEALLQVADHARTIVGLLNDTGKLPIQLVWKPTLTQAQEVYKCCMEANSHPDCIGIITWMHTFSPAKMWINGLNTLQKPVLHLHTQYGRDIPWSSIDMDYMNLHQSAHGDREYGYIHTRMRKNRKVVVGHNQDPEVIENIERWSRAALAWNELQGMKIARFGDNMREVAVTEGDKVAAQIQFGYSVNTFGIGDLAARIQAVEDSAIASLMEEYRQVYRLSETLLPGGTQRSSLAEAARIELGLSSFLKEGGFSAFTDTFEDLHGIQQLPGIAVQRLMHAGYGFGAEGDWKTAALVRAMKIMAVGMDGGNSFMEDYTYHFDPSGMGVLGAHMLEICPSITRQQPSCEIHPLGIGGKADPVRLVFTASEGPALNASMIDMGNRFRLLVNTVDAINPPEALPKLPVAHVFWKPHPNLKSAAEAWILAGGAHHTCYSQNLRPEHLEDFAEMANIEYVRIDSATDLRELKKELRWNEMYYHLAQGIRA